MIFEKELTKSNEYTLKLNDNYIYSKYEPVKNARKLILEEVNHDSKAYLLIGLGLGYHLKSLVDIVQNKSIFVLLLDIQEVDLYKSTLVNEDAFKLPNVSLLQNIGQLEYIHVEELQVIIPNAWIKALQIDHPLFPVLEDIKIRQSSYLSSLKLLDYNFKKNIKNNNLFAVNLKGIFENYSACLISSGPSLDETISLLTKMKNKCFILCVGSALKALLKNEIIPDAIIITDPSKNVVDQIKDSSFTGTLFYLSTACHEMSEIHLGKKVILFQEGYKNSLIYSQINKQPLFETGGSVATTALSLLEFLGFENLYLFGQDLGFHSQQTHSQNSTSGISIAKNTSFRKIVSNDGGFINTTSNLHTYLRWFENKAKNTSLNIINTAYKGAKIEGIPYSPLEIIEEKYKNKNPNIFDNILNSKLTKEIDIKK